MSKKKHKATRSRSDDGARIADTADKYQLYQQAVQCPPAEVELFVRAYRKAYRREPLLLREDFCGTAAVSCAWVASHRRREAWGVDLDPEPLQWGEERNLSQLKPSAQQRVELRVGDVRTVQTPKVDVLAAQNFSFYIFKRRAEVIDYFRVARESLAEEGIFVLDVFGGPDAISEDRREKRHCSGFEYVWDQQRFDPITHECVFHIHFGFADGSKLKRAFTYEWRWWSIPEVREMLDEAGFRRSRVYWEGTDERTGEGNGVFRRRAHAPSDPAWVAYVVGIK